MQHSQQLYGSRLRAFQAEHGITDSRSTQPPAARPIAVPAPFPSLPPSSSRGWRVLQIVGWTLLGIVNALVWTMFAWASCGSSGVIR